MTLKLITAIAIAGSILAGAGAAEAGNRGQGFKPHDSFQTAGHKRHGKHGRFNRHFHFNDHGYYGGRPYRACRWMKRKAYYTGSRYWWKRYRRCVNRNY